MQPFVLIAACQGSDRVTVDRGVKAPRMMSSSLSCSDNLMSEEELLLHGYHSNSHPSPVRGREGGSGSYTPVHAVHQLLHTKRNLRSWGPLCMLRSAEDDS